MRRIIFLDIDGVLNGYNLRIHFNTMILKKILPSKIFRKLFDIFAVHFVKVFILAIICHLTRADVVLTSSWRYGYWTVPYHLLSDRCKKLRILIKFFRINIIGVTGHYPSERGLQINEYLRPRIKDQIESYLIIDDEMFDIKEYFPEDRLLCTKADPNRKLKFNCAGCYDGAGLRFKHIIPAIRKLKNNL